MKRYDLRGCDEYPGCDPMVEDPDGDWIHGDDVVILEGRLGVVERIVRDVICEIPDYDETPHGTAEAVRVWVVRAQQAEERADALAAICQGKDDARAELEAQIRDLRREVAELEASADLHSRMLERARQLWNEAHPGSEDRWPDGAKNVAWLVERIADLEADLADGPI